MRTRNEKLKLNFLADGNVVADLRTRLTALRIILFALFLIAASFANAQKHDTANVPKPLEALGMSCEKFITYLGTCQKECRQHQKDARQGNRTTFEFPPYAYTFEGGKIIEVMITANSFDAFLDEGKEKWGPPTSLTYQLLANQDGTESRNGTAHWDLPGGVVVDARQTPVPGKVVDVTKLHLGGPTVYLTQKEPATQGALVIITNPSALKKDLPKPQHLL